jgi:hypothetical protein
MPLDGSIYSLIRPIEAPDMLGMASKAMTMKQLAMQNDRLQREDAEDQAIKQVYSSTLGPDGKPTQATLSALARINPGKAMQAQEQYAKSNQLDAEAEAKKQQMHEQKAMRFGESVASLATMPQQEQIKAWPQFREQLVAQGLQTPDQIPVDYDPQYIGMNFRKYQQTKPYFDQQKTMAGIAKDKADTALAYAKAGKPPKGMTQVRDPETGEITLAPIAGSAKPSQYTAAGFATRVEQAEKVFGDLSAKAFDPTSNSSVLQRNEFYPEKLMGEDNKKQAQAERNFVNAILRRESGAAIAPAEFSSAESQYFPRAGDTPDVVAQKAENRRIALAALKAESGPALQEVQGQLAAIPKAPARSDQPGGLIPSANASEKTPKKKYGWEP